MPPKNNNSWWSARQQSLEIRTREPTNFNNEPGPANVRNQDEPQMMLGMSELIEFINALATAAPGTRPQMNAEQIEKIKKSPLKPVLQALQPIYRKIVEAPSEPEKPPPAGVRLPAPQPTPTPGPGPSSAQEPPPVAVLDSTELKDIEAGVKLLSSKLDAVSQAVADVATQKVMGSNLRTLEDNLRQADSETRDAVKASATVSKTHLEAVDSKISQMSGKLDPALHELSQGIKKLQVGLAENAKADKARLEAKVNELEKENKELQQAIDATRTELLPVEDASKIALQGTFTEDADKSSTRGGAANATGNVVQTAKRVRTNTLGLIAKCWALFTFINRDPTTGSNVPDLGTEGEWGRCAEHLRASNTRLRSAIEEKEESAQKLQFFGFVVDQIRKGRYTEKEWTSGITGGRFATLIENSPDGFASIQLLAQDISRLTAPVLPIAPVYGIPPVYETPPATPAANATFQAPTIPMAYAGASTVKPTTGGTRPRGRGNASTTQSSAATSSLASLLSS